MWEEIAFVKQSKTAVEILKRLQEPKTPSELAKDLNLHQQSVSNTITKLEERGLAKCITPERHNYRHYIITNKGKILLQKMGT
jgi:DNA-binding MarR family transcriptional regulator